MKYNIIFNVLGMMMVAPVLYIILSVNIDIWRVLSRTEKQSDVKLYTYHKNKKKKRERKTCKINFTTTVLDYKT